MQSRGDVPPSPLRNAFAAEFLAWMDRRDEPSTVAEADAAGPWTVRPHPDGGWAVLRAAERLDEGDLPAGVFRQIESARLMAAVLPGTGRDPELRLGADEEPAGYPVEGLAGRAGHIRLFDEGLVAALNVADSLVRSPEALAWLLEAAGRITLEHAGRILARRLGDSRFAEELDEELVPAGR